MQKISDEIAGYTQVLFPQKTTDRSIKILIEKEFIRRLTGYRHTIRLLEQKYQTDFANFKKMESVKNNNYSFEIENDFCEWEMALDGVETIGKKLRQIREYYYSD